MRRLCRPDDFCVARKAAFRGLVVARLSKHAGLRLAVRRLQCWDSQYASCGMSATNAENIFRGTTTDDGLHSSLRHHDQVFRTLGPHFPSGNGKVWQNHEVPEKEAGERLCESQRSCKASRQEKAVSRSARGNGIAKHPGSGLRNSLRRTSLSQGRAFRSRYVMRESFSLCTTSRESWGR